MKELLELLETEIVRNGTTPTPSAWKKLRRKVRDQIHAKPVVEAVVPEFEPEPEPEEFVESVQIITPDETVTTKVVGQFNDGEENYDITQTTVKWNDGEEEYDVEVD